MKAAHLEIQHLVDIQERYQEIIQGGRFPLPLSWLWPDQSTLGRILGEINTSLADSEYSVSAPSSWDEDSRLVIKADENGELVIEVFDGFSEEDKEQNPAEYKKMLAAIDLFNAEIIKYLAGDALSYLDAPHGPDVFRLIDLIDQKPEN